MEGVIAPNQIATSQLINYYDIEFMRVEIDNSTRRLIHYTIGTFGLTLTRAPSDFVKIALAKKIYPNVANERNVTIRKMIEGQTPNSRFSIDVDLDTKTITKGAYKNMQIKTVAPGQKIKFILNEYTVRLGRPEVTGDHEITPIGIYKITLAQGANDVALIASLKRMYPEITKYRNVSILQKTRKSVTMVLDLDKLIVHTQNRENQETLIEGK